METSSIFGLTSNSRADDAKRQSLDPNDVQASTNGCFCLRRSMGASATFDPKRSFRQFPPARIFE